MNDNGFNEISAISVASFLDTDAAGTLKPF